MYDLPRQTQPVQELALLAGQPRQSRKLEPRDKKMPRHKPRRCLQSPANPSHKKQREMVAS